MTKGKMIVVIPGATERDLEWFATKISEPGVNILFHLPIQVYEISDGTMYEVRQSLVPVAKLDAKGTFKPVEEY